MKHESVEYFSSRITSDNFVVVDSQNEHSTNPNKRVVDCKLKKSAGFESYSDWIMVWSIGRLTI